MPFRHLMMHLVSGLATLPRRLGLSAAALPAQPLVELFRIEGGVYCGGIRMRTDTDWEMHPDGDETLTLVSGRIDVVLDRPDASEVVELRPGQSAIVPAGVWHRQIVLAESALLFMTPGDTTQHRKCRDRAIGVNA
ncbi:MAG: cupin domain-containing protein [Pseudomonadota bacterium]